ncbi:hypothetical protein HGB07_03305 [Candidatus Roizmanbacteria bacterium]|nr:hypothetical protein [Candidatus Roizmanbacteria bacterium]
MALNYTPLKMPGTKSADYSSLFSMLKLPLILMGGGGAFLLFLIFVGLALHPRQTSSTDAVASPTPRPKNLTPVPTSQLVPDTTGNYSLYTVPNVATFKVPSDWVATAIQPLKTVDPRLYTRRCNGPYLISNSTPSAVIVLDIQTAATSSASCISRGDLEDFTYRHISTFTPPKDIKVVKWKENTSYEAGIIRQSVWDRDLLEQYSYISDELDKRLQFSLFFKDDGVNKPERIFDVILASVQFLPKPVVVREELSPYELKSLKFSVPKSWTVKKNSPNSDQNFYLLNPTAFKESENPAISIVYAPQVSLIDQKQKLITSLALEQVEEKSILVGERAGLQITGFAKTTSLNKTVIITLLPYGNSVYIVQDFATINDHLTQYNTLLSRMAFSGE